MEVRCGKVTPLRVRGGSQIDGNWNRIKVEGVRDPPAGIARAWRKLRTSQNGRAGGLTVGRDLDG